MLRLEVVAEEKDEMIRPKKNYMPHMQRVPSAREEKQAIERLRMEERLQAVVQRARDEETYGVRRQAVRMRTPGERNHGPAAGGGS